MADDTGAGGDGSLFAAGDAASAPVSGSGAGGGGDSKPKAFGGAKEPHRSRKRKGQDMAAEGQDMPQKRWFRQRAHCNPLSHNDAFDYPLRPTDIDWSTHFPKFVPPRVASGDGGDSGAAGAGAAAAAPDAPRVEFADVGCGFGGLLIGLSPVFPDKLIMGFEIRDKVTEYVRLRIAALRKEHPGQYQNVSVLKTNAMKYMPNTLVKGQLSKMFFCFPDPHFKTKNHKRRIISPTLLTEYAYFLRPGGMLYTISDVRELHEWMARHGDEHALFERVSDEELATDPAVPIVMADTEEGKKVARNKGEKHLAVFRRLEDDEADRRVLATGFWHAGGATGAAAASGDGGPASAGGDGAAAAAAASGAGAGAGAAAS